MEITKDPSRSRRLRELLAIIAEESLRNLFCSRLLAQWLFVLHLTKSVSSLIVRWFVQSGRTGAREAVPRIALTE